MKKPAKPNSCPSNVIVLASPVILKSPHSKGTPGAEVGVEANYPLFEQAKMMAMRNRRFQSKMKVMRDRRQKIRPNK